MLSTMSPQGLARLPCSAQTLPPVCWHREGISTSTGRSGGKPIPLLYELAEIDELDIAGKMQFALNHSVTIGPSFYFHAVYQCVNFNLRRALHLHPAMITALGKFGKLAVARYQ